MIQGVPWVLDRLQAIQDVPWVLAHRLVMLMDHRVLVLQVLQGFLVHQPVYHRVADFHP